MQKDFDKWLEVMLGQRAVVTGGTGTNTPSLSTQKNFLSMTKNDLGNTRTDLNKSVLSQVTTTSHIENVRFGIFFIVRKRLTTESKGTCRHSTRPGKKYIRVFLIIDRCEA
jgi:hypothetical protein